MSIAILHRLTPQIAGVKLPYPAAWSDVSGTNSRVFQFHFLSALSLEVLPSTRQKSLLIHTGLQPGVRLSEC
jgi:hypothetical protein